MSEAESSLSEPNPGTSAPPRHLIKSGRTMSRGWTLAPRRGNLRRRALRGPRRWLVFVAGLFFGVALIVWLWPSAKSQISLSPAGARIFAHTVPLPATLLLIGLGVILTPWLLSKWRVNRSPELRVENHFARENEARKRLAQIIGGILVLAGLYSSGQTFDFQRYRVANAIDQLGAVQAGGKMDANGNPQINLEVRLGGIHALERIAQDSPKDHWTVMQALTAYVRENSSATGLAVGPSGNQLRAKTKDQQPETQWQPPRADIQAILTVIGRRDITHDPPGRSFDLQNTDLREADLFRAVLRNGYFYGANLSGANLEEADLNEVSLGGAVLHRSVLQSADLSGAFLDHADLRAAILVMTHLNRADLYGADLSGADLYGANLNGANLNGANLSEADLSWANLNGADLYEADLHGTNLSWADLREVVGLKQEQLDAAFGNASTKLPQGFIRPESWGR